MIGPDDTIAAIATPPGRGAIAMVRMSGPEAHQIAGACLSPFPGASHTATLCNVRDADGLLVDRAVVTRHDAPRSYTGEDVVEIAGHGGIRSPAAILACLIRAGARPAEPGEFTRRAVLNGKMDLAQAAGVGGVIDAPTEAARRSALHHADGGFSRRITSLRDRVLDLEALLAYEIDFPEEDDGPVDPARIDEALQALRNELRAILATAPIGEMVREGAVVVLAGRPNVGKSSLFNALLGIERAIVHASPGTTRDAIEAVIEAGRWPLRLVDTAGLRDSADEIEQTGVEISLRYLARAHLVLACGDTAADIRAAMEAIESATPSRIVAVRTKSDLAEAAAEDELADLEAPLVVVSARQREGLAELVAAIERELDTAHGSLDPDLPLLDRAWQQAAIERAERELAAFENAWREASVPMSVAAVHIQAAAVALASIIGAVEFEDVLTRVFSTFCVGK